MTLDKLIESVEDFNGIEITDDTLVIRDMYIPDEELEDGIPRHFLTRDYSFKLIDIEDYRIYPDGADIRFLLRLKGKKSVFIYRNREISVH